MSEETNCDEKSSRKPWIGFYHPHCLTFFTPLITMEHRRFTLSNIILHTSSQMCSIILSSNIHNICLQAKTSVKRKKKQFYLDIPFLPHPNNHLRHHEITSQQYTPDGWRKNDIVLTIVVEKKMKRWGRKVKEVKRPSMKP